MNEPKPNRLRGRPAKNPGEKRTSHTFRLRDTTRQQIIKDAQASGRSLSEEIEWKVEAIVQWERAHAGPMLAEADIQADESRHKQLARLHQALDFRAARFPSGRSAILDAGTVADLGRKISDPVEVLRYFGGEPIGTARATVIEALRETIKPDLLQPEKDPTDEGQHHPARED